MTTLPVLHQVHDYLAYHARHRGSQEAVVCGDERLTYSELKRRVEDCARGLIAAGIEPGDRVATLSGMRTEFLVVFLATSMVGAIWMGLNPRYRRQELEHVLTDGQPRILFSATRFLGQDIVADLKALAGIAPSLERVILLDNGCADADRFEHFDDFVRDGAGVDGIARRPDRRTGRDPVLLVYTSGSTGKPKGALLTHEGLIARALNQNRVWPCDPIRVANHLPINHIGGVGFISTYCLVGGGTQFLDEKFDPARFIARVRDDRLTIWITLPTIALMVLGHPEFSAEIFSDLQWAVWSGAALPVSAVRRLRALGCRIGSSYGLTESSGSVCYAGPELDDETLSRTIGRPVPDGEVRLADENGRPVERGSPGEIQLRPEWAMQAYLGQPEASRQARTPDGFVRTGDIGREDEAGCIELVGRLKEMFKSGGYNVYPREVEAAVEEHPGVAICAVVPVPHPLFQEVGVAFVQPKGSGAVDPDDMREWCAGRLANYKIPKQFRIVPELPVLGVGKVDRQSLRRLAAELDQSAADLRGAPPPHPEKTLSKGDAT